MENPYIYIHLIVHHYITNVNMSRRNPSKPPGKVPDKLKKYKWKKGETGNPNGRPKVIPKLEVLLKQLLGTTSDNPEDSEIFKILKSLAEDAKDKKSRHKSRAADILLERAFGKAVEKVKDEDEEKESKEKIINVIADQKRIDELTKSKDK